MKRMVIFLLAGIFLTGTIFAQDRAERPERQREVKAVTIDGTLKLEKGMIAVESGDSLFIIPVLNRYINFINGLKEGAKISVEGNAFRNFIMPKKITIDGNSYDLAMTNPAERMRNFDFSQRRGQFGPGMNNKFSPQRKNLPQRNNMTPKNNMPNRRDNKKPGGCNCDMG